ncbi:MAG TPA: Wzz/FepE/Etk N-terminal domain-containing protein, partial [Saprospiraceae bacterium]|nr:Wzz/FepE/Etk N-terminal domain-containing protein [Saprospiraceae bacterium]
MTEQQPPGYIQDDEITLKDLILKIQEFWRLLWANKWYIIAFALILASLSALRTYLTPSQFPAKLTFMVNEDEGSNMGGIANVLGQFGFSSGGKSEYNLDRILELSRS